MSSETFSIHFQYINFFSYRVHMDDNWNSTKLNRLKSVCVYFLVIEIQLSHLFIQLGWLKETILWNRMRLVQIERSNVSYFWQQISMDIGHIIIDRVGWKVRRQILFDSYSYTLIKPKLNPINWKLGPSVRKSRKYNRTFCEINLKMKLTQTEHSTLVIRSEFFNPKTVAITCHWSFVRNILVNLLHWSCKCILTLPENALKPPWSVLSVHIHAKTHYYLYYFLLHFLFTFHIPVYF